MNSTQYPGTDRSVTYAEELLVGYRWYDDRGITPAFPFGHGLGYTTIEITNSRWSRPTNPFEPPFD